MGVMVGRLVGVVVDVPLGVSVGSEGGLQRGVIMPDSQSVGGGTVMPTSGYSFRNPEDGASGRHR